MKFAGDQCLRLLPWFAPYLFDVRFSHLTRHRDDGSKRNVVTEIPENTYAERSPPRSSQITKARRAFLWSSILPSVHGDSCVIMKGYILRDLAADGKDDIVVLDEEPTEIIRRDIFGWQGGRMPVQIGARTHNFSNPT